MRKLTVLSNPLKSFPSTSCREERLSCAFFLETLTVSSAFTLPLLSLNFLGNMRAAQMQVTTRRQRSRTR